MLFSDVNAVMLDSGWCFVKLYVLLGNPAGNKRHDNCSTIWENAYIPFLNDLARCLKMKRIKAIVNEKLGQRKSVQNHLIFKQMKSIKLLEMPCRVKYSDSNEKNMFSFAVQLSIQFREMWGEISRQQKKYGCKCIFRPHTSQLAISCRKFFCKSARI